MWHSSAERKRQERAEREGERGGGGGGGSGGLQPAPSGKGDRFLSNLVPSFIKREG